MNKQINKFGHKSLAVRETLDPRLQWLVDELLLYVDISLIYGTRGEAEQNALFGAGKSKLRFPFSKHNSNPSQAVDLQPYPYPRKENDLRAGLGYIAGLAVALARIKGFNIRWGGDWNMNGDVVDNGFDDLFHLELVE